MDIRDDSVSKNPSTQESHSFSPPVTPNSGLNKKIKSVFNSRIETPKGVNDPLPIKLSSPLKALQQLSLPTRDWVETGELTCRLTTKEKDSLYAALESLPDIDTEVAHLSDVAKTGNWEDPIFNNPNLPYYYLSCTTSSAKSQLKSLLQSKSI
ncbi:MAG: hypothetical protein LVR00_02570 [Rhabdochlamydiaceae bacterium]|jgi:hypothetical protein